MVETGLELNDAPDAKIREKDCRFLNSRGACFFEQRQFWQKLKISGSIFDPFETLNQKFQTKIW